jgi:hypothetical protein
MEPLPVGSIPVTQFNSSKVPNYHFFFDDDEGNIEDVRNAAIDRGVQLHSVHCPPGPIVLHDVEGRPMTITNDPAEYILLKSQDTSFSHDFRKFLKTHTEKRIGNSMTPDMIRQIIAHEETSREFKPVYFFDFDMLLSQINGLTFGFFNVINDDAESLLKQYAKYLFSDHIGAEPASGGRLMLLQTMFETIGADRIYVVTSNPFANEQIRKKNGEMGPNPVLKHFIGILQLLLSTFIPTHLVCTNSTNEEPLYNKKSDAIMDVLKYRAEVMPEPAMMMPKPVKTKSATTKPNKDLTKPVKSAMTKSVKSAMTKSKSTMSVKPKSAITKSATTSATRKRKGGFKWMRHTRRKRRIA